MDVSMVSMPTLSQKSKTPKSKKIILLINKFIEDVKRLDELYQNSNLPDTCDKDFVNDLLLQVRKL